MTQRSNTQPDPECWNSKKQINDQVTYRDKWHFRKVKACYTLKQTQEMHQQMYHIDLEATWLNIE